MSNSPVGEGGGNGKRRFLLAASSFVGGVSALGAATPFFLSLFPSQRARAAGAPVEFDLSKVEPGMIVTVEWRGKPVWVVHRTEGMLADLEKNTEQLADPMSEVANQPDDCKNTARAKNPKYLVIEGICTHLGCSPSAKLQAGVDSGLGADWKGGFFCPCHGSKFDLAGRVFKGVPAPSNLRVPQYTFLSDTRVLIGADSKEA